MIMQIWEAADKMTILKVKQNKGLPVDGQLSEYAKDIKRVPKELFDNLYRINLFMFEMEDVISRAFELKNYEMAGHLYYVLRGLTHERTKAKHTIAKICNEPLEVKQYGEYGY